MLIERPGRTGSGVWDRDQLGSALNDLDRAGFAWHYAWTTGEARDPDPTPGGSDVVVMARDETWVTPERLDAAVVWGATTHLGFNRLDNPGQPT